MKFLKPILTFVTFLKNYMRSVLLAFSLKGPKAYPLLGNVTVLRDTSYLLTEANNLTEKYGTVVRSWMSIVPFIWLSEPRHLKIILGSSKISEKNVFYKILHNFLGPGLITSNGTKWKNNRKLLQPYFHINILENYINIFVKTSKNILPKLEPNENLNITRFINDFVLETLHLSILGVPVNADSPYRKGETNFIERVTKPWLLLETFFKFTSKAKMEQEQKLSLYDYTRKVVLQRQISQEKPGICLLNYMLEMSKNNPAFTLEDIINESITFMLAGQDSVGATLAFVIYFIAKNENIQNRIVEEIDSVNTDNVTIAVLNELKYLEQVIKETLRLIPSIPVICRVLKEDVVLDGHVIPAGTNLAISSLVTHRLPHVYKDPLKFDPDRFSHENLEKLDLYAFIPFSMGPRNCIGYKFAILEMKTMLFHLLKKFKFSLAVDYDELNLVYRTTLRAKGGIRLNVQLR